jgi:hypothetical protein
MYFVDLNDAYFYGGDVLRYFWYATDDDLGRTSHPPGISTVPPTSLQDAELATGGLLEVNFLPTITWSPEYLARVAAHPNGDVAPTSQEIANSSQTNCILYVNKVNTRRRSGSANRTSFMYTLDRIGYAGKYDVYDVQGFGGVINDLASRATPDFAGGYSVIIHDAGKLRDGALPDGTSPVFAPVHQDLWYWAWLDLYGSFGLHPVATLWVIGENIAATTKASPLLDVMGAGLGSDDIAVPLVEARSSASARFVQLEGYNGPIAFPTLTLTGGCTEGRNYDELLEPLLGSPIPGDDAEYAATHVFRGQGGTPADAGKAVIMSNHIVPGVPVSRFNTIFMAFPWSDVVASAGQPSSAAEIMANSIMANVLAGTCAAGAPSDVDEQVQVAPLLTLLHSPHPNPANPTTTIRFDLGTSGRARVHVFDVAGRLVRSLVDTDMESGHHVVHWDGRNTSGVPVSAGVYVCRLDAADVSQSQKLVIVR